ncbi:response regulator [Sphingomonas qilianensis]|uniref:Response regulator n=1 Tax=Sphingomonas qilianensis TaxID=1736690 RepID=A0ABU9XVA9_9SPHN
MTEQDPAAKPGAILIVDGDILSRHAIADFLRRCGHGVVEAVNTDEAFIALGDASLAVDVILCDIAAIGTRSGFELASWVRRNRPELEVRLAGSLAGIADNAAAICESGPHLARPYEPDAVVDYVTQLRAKRDHDSAVARQSS